MMLRLAVNSLYWRRLTAVAVAIAVTSCTNIGYSNSVVIDRSQYARQLEGFWLGQNIANWTGLITEMDKVGTAETLPFYTDADWQSQDLANMWGNMVPHASTIDFYFELNDSPWGADDDTDIEYMYQQLHLDYQTARLTPKQIQQGWLKYIYPHQQAPFYRQFPHQTPQRENFLWASNQQALDLMQQGMLPPQTSDPTNNDQYQMIDAQLTTELFGLLSPNNPEVALQLASLPIHTTASGDAAHAAQFYVVMHALAAGSKAVAAEQLPAHTIKLAQQARTYIPDSSYIAKMYDFVWQSYQANPNRDHWALTRDAVYQRYQLNQHDGYVYTGPFDAGINFAASLVSWFYGQGDIKRTIKIGTLVGWDSDNPTATWGGLLGFILAKDGVELAFGRDDLSQGYWIGRTRRNFVDHTPEQAGEDRFDLMAKRLIPIIDKVVHEQINARVDLNNNQWIIYN